MERSRKWFYFVVLTLIPTTVLGFCLFWVLNNSQKYDFVHITVGSLFIIVPGVMGFLFKPNDPTVSLGKAFLYSWAISFVGVSAGLLFTLKGEVFEYLQIHPAAFLLVLMSSFAFSLFYKETQYSHHKKKSLITGRGTVS